MRRWPAVVVCVLAMTGCATAEGNFDGSIRRLPAASVVDAAVSVPDANARQVAVSVGPVSDAVGDMLARGEFGDVPAGASPELVISGRVGSVHTGIAFFADVPDAVYTFTDDERIGRVPWGGPTALDMVDDPLVVWTMEGQTDDRDPSKEAVVLIGGWADPSIATVAVQRAGEWLSADTVDVPGASMHGWAAVLDDPSWLEGAVDAVAGYDGEGRLLAALPTPWGVLPRAALGLRGGGFTAADVGLRAPADIPTADLRYGPGEEIAAHTVPIAGVGWTAVLAREQRRVFLGAGPRNVERSGEVRPDLAVARTVDGDADVAGVVASGKGSDVVAAGYAAEHVAAVRITFHDGAWLEVPTRTTPEVAPATTPDPAARLWAVAATRVPSDARADAAHLEALDEHGNVLSRSAAETAP